MSESSGIENNGIPVRYRLLHKVIEMLHCAITDNSPKHILRVHLLLLEMYANIHRKQSQTRYILKLYPRCLHALGVLIGDAIASNPELLREHRLVASARDRRRSAPSTLKSLWHHPLTLQCSSPGRLYHKHSHNR